MPHSDIRAWEAHRCLAGIRRQSWMGTEGMGLAGRSKRVVGAGAQKGRQGSQRSR